VSVVLAGCAAAKPAQTQAILVVFKVPAVAVEQVSIAGVGLLPQIKSTMATIEEQNQELERLMTLVSDLGLADSAAGPHATPVFNDGVLRCRAEFDNVADQPKELAFKEGDIITVLTQDISGWWKGELHGAVGWFPASFVELLETNRVCCSALLNILCA
jgi:hypothetical protein